MNPALKPILLFISLCSFLMACGENTPKPTITQVALTVPNVNMLSGSSQNISADVTGTGTFDPTVNWTVTDGTLQKTTGALNSYTAPTVTVSKTVIVTATSKADPTKFAVASITINPIPPSSSITAVTASAAKSALAAAEVTALTATVTGTGSFSNAVTWSISSGDGTLGTASGSSINFTAPSKTTASTTVIKATSTQDSSKFAEVSISTAALGVTPPTVSISSPSVDVFTKGTVNFQVVVTGAPDSVELLRDGAVLVALNAPYTYAWDTTSEPEKTYSITAKAKKAGTADVISAVKQVTVDRTAPTLVSQVPANGAVNVFLADEISATFSEPLLASSVSTSSVQLKIGSNVIASTPSLNAAGTKVTIVPTMLPALTATINMVFTGLTDKAGNVAVIANSNFVAPDWLSIGAIVDNTPSKNASSPAIAVDPSGNPIVTWVENDGTTYNIYAKKWNGTSWASLGTTLDNDPSKNAYYPAIAIDSSGNPIVTWYEYDGTSENIYTKKWNGTSWASLGTTLDNDPNKAAYYPAIALDSSGNPIVTWEENDGTSFNVYAKKWNGAGWTSLGTTLDYTRSQNALRPDITIDSSGNPNVTWYENDGTSDNIYAKKWNGAGWTSLGATLDNDSSKTARDPAIAIDSSGNPIVIWYESDGTSYNIYVKQLNRIP